MLRPVVGPVNVPVRDADVAHVAMFVVPATLDQLVNLRVIRLAPVGLPETPALLIQRLDHHQARIGPKPLLNEATPAECLPFRVRNPLADTWSCGSVVSVNTRHGRPLPRPGGG